MQDLKSVRVFLEVADRLSFAGAARALGMTPASVTRIVATLEKEFGQQLFVRTTRQVSLTSAGAMVADRFRPVVEAFDRAFQEILRAGKPDLGRLRISAPLSLGILVLPPLVEGFRLAYPRVDLDLQLTDRLVDIIVEDCDLAIRISGPPSDKSTIWRKICEVPRSLVAAPRLLERIAVPGHPDDLDPVSMLSYSATGRPETWLLRRGDEARSLRAGSGVTANNGDLLCRLAEEGAGICLLPDFIVRDALLARRLVRVLPGWRVSSLWLTLYYPPYERLPPLVATFSDFFESFIRGLDSMDFG